MLPTNFQFIWILVSDWLISKKIFSSVKRKITFAIIYTLQVGIHILIFFLANLAKGNMSFCHHLVSVVCHQFTFHILIFRDEMSKLYRGHSIDDFYQVSVVAMFVNRSG
jgi:uncharacterized membrane protein